ncbi:GNAT family N-acetyltransferase [Kribbella sp. NPDC026611]|uniref:GNAT family N-acetyltransferase n=1 Tax=Kribbella sp. NPDC026611 TaxID=3154911 RepID=UPI0033FC19CE
MSFPRIEAEGLVLREWTEDDLAAMQALFDDAEVAYRTPLPSPFDESAARKYLASAREAHANGKRLHWAITTDGQRPLGEILLNQVTGGIGYIVGAPHRGQRLGVRALTAVTQHAHEVAGVRRLILEIEPNNLPSIAVARSAGFHPTDHPLETVTDKARTYPLAIWQHTIPPVRTGHARD